MSINYKELETMIDNINSVINDVNEETRKTNRIVMEERLNFFTEVIKPELTELTELCKRVAPTYSYTIELKDIQNRELRVEDSTPRKGQTLVFHNGEVRLITRCWNFSNLLRETSIKPERGDLLAFIDSYEDVQEYIQTKLVEEIQNELSKRAEKAHTELEKARKEMNEVIPERTYIDDFK